MKEDVIWFHGREYVSKTEFAKRMNVTVRTIEKYIKDKSLTPYDVTKKNIPYLAWDTQSKQYELAKNKKTNVSSRFVKKKPNELNELKADTLPSDNLDGEEIKVGDDVIVLHDIDPYKFKSCWVLGESGDPIENPVTHKPELDLDKLKNTMQVLLAEQKYNITNGTLIPKEDLLPTLSTIASKIPIYLSSIPSRFGSIYRSVCESVIGRTLTAEEATKFTNVLRSDIQKQCEDLQAEIKRWAEDV